MLKCLGISLSCLLLLVNTDSKALKRWLQTGKLRDHFETIEVFRLSSSAAF